MRRFVAALAATVALSAPAAANAAGFPLGDTVDTRIGTEEGAIDFGTGGGAGASYPGATAPFGAIQFSPETMPGIGNYAGGYTYSDDQVKGFGLTHLEGAGCAGLGDIPILPTTHAVDVSPSTAGSYDVDPRYVSSFTHSGEVARAGDYRLSHGGMRTELTSIRRAAAMRVRFPAGSDGSFLVNAGGSSMGNMLADLHVDPERREITGSIGGGGFCFARAGYRIFFAIRFDDAFADSGTWTKQVLQPGGTDSSDSSTGATSPLWGLQYKRLAGGPDEFPGHPSTGAQAGAYATFDRRTVSADVAISSVSVAGARKNLATTGGRSFDALRRAARSRWEDMLGRIRVKGGSSGHRTTFYSALYHSAVMPNVFSDADGRYRGMDGQVHRARGYAKYANISGWDTYRSQMPLMAVLAPKAASDLATSMVADYRESGHLPKWPVREGQTNVMVGDPADLLIAGAHAFGARRFDTGEALAAMVDGATHPGTSGNGDYVQRAGLEDYKRLGYVGYEDNTNSAGQSINPQLAWATASTSLEYALADFGIARFAAVTGRKKTCTRFAGRTTNWRESLDPSVGRMQPRMAETGAFVPVAADGDNGFAEGSAEQYTWFVPHDVTGLISALGGRDVARNRLDAFLSELNTGGQSVHAFLGNEPTLQTPYIYDWLGAPGRGAKAVREAMLTLYKPTPGGFPGNDDGGAMSSWWVWSALGMYPSVPGTGILTLSSPLFKRAVVELPHGRELVIGAPKAAPDRPYVASARIGKRALEKPWLRWSTLSRGADIRFNLTARDGRKWGTDQSDAPPSFPKGRLCGAP